MTPWQHLVDTPVSLNVPCMELATPDDLARKTLLDMNFNESVTHPGVFQHETRYILFVCMWTICCTQDNVKI